LEGSGDDLEAVTKFLDSAGRFSTFTGLTFSLSQLLLDSGQKLDYRRYGVNLIEILIAGGLLAPGGIVQQEGENVCQTKVCLFGLADSMEKIRAFEQVLKKDKREVLQATLQSNISRFQGVHQVDAPLQIP